jgi:2-polyprenyl-6-methoxyphenol hydroxylase-like FAD-dependent oxidoreductase
MAEDLTGRRALVLGAGMAGGLTAAALTPFFDRVTLVERDHLTGAGTDRRAGLPQAGHAHLLLGSGARWIDALLPGTTQVLCDSGAHRLSMPAQVHTLSPHGWLPAIPEIQFLLSGTRSLIDTVVRERLLAGGRIELLTGTEVAGLMGDATRVTGARLRDRTTGAFRDEPATMVFDATGATSAAIAWLAELGTAPVATTVVDAGVGYATRTLRLPDAWRRLGAIYLQADPDGSGRGGVLLPVEDDRWLLSLSGVRGQNPPTDEPGFDAFVASLRHPVLAEALAQATPIGPIRGFRKLANRWRHFERLRRGPEGFVVLGDAARSYNPAYGHGMSVAARSANVVREMMARHGSAPDLTRRLQRAVAGCADDAWAIASGQDARYLTDTRPGPVERLQRWYTNRLGRAAVHRPAVTKALLQSFTLDAPAGRLLAPRIVGKVLTTTDSPPPPPPVAPEALPHRLPPDPATGRKTS